MKLRLSSFSHSPCRFPRAARPDTRRSARAGTGKKSAHSEGQDCGGTSRWSAPCFPFYRTACLLSQGAPRRARGQARRTTAEPAFCACARFLSSATLSSGNSGLVAAWRHRSADRHPRVECCSRGTLHEVRTAFYTAFYERALEELGRSQRQRLDENLMSEKARYEAGTWTAARSPPRLCRPENSIRKLKVRIGPTAPPSSNWRPFWTTISLPAGLRWPRFP